LTKKFSNIEKTCATPPFASARRIFKIHKKANFYKFVFCFSHSERGRRGGSPRPPVPLPFFFEIYRKEKRQRDYKKALAFYQNLNFPYSKLKISLF